MSKEAIEMVDDEGENRAVRMFLALYGGACGVTVDQMRKHLKMAGFDGAWPEWASNHNGHLTKAGAQLWIRHLFSLEQPAQKPEWIETACALIKAADDASADSDYMLDSNDCIKVLRGQWKGPLMNDQPAAPQPA